MPAEGRHAAAVAAWLERLPPNLSAGQRLDLLERALEALWRRANMTLGEVTLVAIAERVLYNAAEQFPPLAALRVERTGFRCADVRPRADDTRPEVITAWTRYVVTEFLTVLGNLTANVLTPPLHAALAAASPPPATAADAATGGESRTRATAAEEES